MNQEKKRHLLDTPVLSVLHINLEVLLYILLAIRRDRRHVLQPGRADAEPRRKPACALFVEAVCRGGL